MSTQPIYIWSLITTNLCAQFYGYILLADRTVVLYQKMTFRPLSAGILPCGPLGAL